MSAAKPQPRYRSAHSILKLLPGAFDVATLSRVAGLDWDSAMTYAWRWKRAELIKPAGPRAGVYYNVTRFPGAESEFASRALLMLYPTAVLNGASVLHAAGWTTQIPQRLTVSVLERRSFLTLEGFQLSGRSREWFTAMHGRYSEDPDLATFGLRSLTPALALADAFANGAKDEWRPSLDDLMLDDADPDEIAEAFETLGVVEPEWMGAALPRP